ncbi:hypothetical protein [Streptomyces amritsarensis]|uniref:hypothetical protein n=1 Tax=Streptomyces amritsarensis TaxID=681158 RepID=UPI003694FAAE
MGLQGYLMILGRVVHRGVKLPNASSFTYQSNVKFSEISQLLGIQISGIQSLQRMEQLFPQCDRVGDFENGVELSLPNSHIIFDRGSNCEQSHDRISLFLVE